MRMCVLWRERKGMGTRKRTINFTLLALSFAIVIPLMTSSMSLTTGQSPKSSLKRNTGVLSAVPNARWVRTNPWLSQTTPFQVNNTAPIKCHARTSFAARSRNVSFPLTVELVIKMVWVWTAGRGHAWKSLLYCTARMVRTGSLNSANCMNNTKGTCLRKHAWK